jgi:hypothetical protein
VAALAFTSPPTIPASSRTQSLNVDDAILQYGEAARYGVASNSRVNAVNARRLGWSPKGPSLAEVVEGHL